MRFYNSFLRAAALFICLLALIARPVDGSDDALPIDGAQLDTRALRFKRNYFHVQVYRSGRKYHSSKGSWIAFHGGDGYVVDNIKEAERFYIFAGQLITSKGRYVHLEFSNGYAIFKWESKRQNNGIWYSRWGDFLSIRGPGFTYGRGEGVCCVGDDGSIFVQRGRGTPFQCHPIDMRPNPGTKPLPPPTHKPTKKPNPPWTTKGPKPTTTYKPPPSTTKGPVTTKTSYTSRTKPPTTMTTATTSTTKVTTATATTTTVQTTTKTTTTTSANPSWDPDPDMYPRAVAFDPEDDDEI